MKYEPPQVSPSGSKDKLPGAANGNPQPSAGSSSQSTSRQAQGKLVFGSNVSRTPKDTQKVLLLFMSSQSYLTGSPKNKKLKKKAAELYVFLNAAGSCKRD